MIMKYPIYDENQTINLVNIRCDTIHSINLFLKMILEKIKELEELVIYLNASDKLVVSQAINFSNKAHKNQTRQSGDPFVTTLLRLQKF